jgi:hypothetical protein
MSSVEELRISPRRLDAHDPVPVGESVLPALQRHGDLDRHVAHGIRADHDVRSLLLQLCAGGLARLDPPHLATLGVRAVGHQ